MKTENLTTGRYPTLTYVPKSIETSFPNTAKPPYIIFHAQKNRRSETCCTGSIIFQKHRSAVALQCKHVLQCPATPRRRQARSACLQRNPVSQCQATDLPPITVYDTSNEMSDQVRHGKETGGGERREEGGERRGSNGRGIPWVHKKHNSRTDASPKRPNHHIKRSVGTRIPENLYRRRTSPPETTSATLPLLKNPKPHHGLHSTQ